MLGLIALTMAIIYLLPKLTTRGPVQRWRPSPWSPLLVIFGGIDTKTVGDLASIKRRTAAVPYPERAAGPGTR